MDYDDLLADPPRVHNGGVYHTDLRFYDYLACVLEPGHRTLETGLGISSVIFALAGVHHTVFYLDAAEGDILNAWLERKGIIHYLEFVAGPSQVTLPAYQPDKPLDVVFVDGNHGFPFPMLDFYFAARWLREGGLFLMDDIRLPAPGMLYSVLAHDKRWTLEDHTHRWAAFRLAERHSLDEEWVTQSLPMGQIARTLAWESVWARAEGEPRRTARRVYRRFRPLSNAGQ